MKKIYFLLLAFSFFSTANAQIVDIPDAEFKAQLLYGWGMYTYAKDLAGNYFKIDANNDQQIQETEALQVGYLSVSGSTIASLVGIEKFTNLKELYCKYSALSSLNLVDLSNLEVLDCSRNQLTSLNVEGLTKLQVIDCFDNYLTSLDLTDCSNLKELKCDLNQIISLNVTGLTNLSVLNCWQNKLSSLDVSSCSNLKELKCDNNQLNSLNVTGLTNLSVINCGSNNLSSLEVTSCSNLKELHCDSNQLNSLNVTGLINLSVINCGSNNLSSLDVTSCSNLKELNCMRNQLISLNVKGLTSLQILRCDKNQIASLDVASLVNLVFLNCNENQLTFLNVAPLVKLVELWCGYNQLTSLDVTTLSNLKIFDCSNNQILTLDLTSIIDLRYLRCNDNLLTNIDISTFSRLYYLNCQNNFITTLNFHSFDSEGIDDPLYFFLDNNQLTSIFIKNGKSESTFTFSNNPNLQYICSDEKDLSSVESMINSYGYKNCHVNSYCSFVLGGTFYTIRGNQKLDSNSNGCDTNDIIMPNLKYAIASGTTGGSMISDASGNYSIPVQAGTHTITPALENPTYFNISPTTVNITFPTQTSPFTQNFCITPNGVRPDLELTLLPLESARPGFDAKYKLVYKNKGNATQSGTVNLTFNDAVLDLVVANPVTTAETLNNLFWDFTNIQPFETREITFTMNVNSPQETPAVINGDILNFTTIITSSATDETPLDNTITLNQTVVGSYDPNDKTCLEGAVITPALIGQYVHYLIRFENTGTFAAENVVIKDMIDLSKFDISTLIPTSASHSYFTKISDGNKVEFIFEKINLPFDDANNDGYIAFKIKTKPTLVVNDSFTNEANIYFDYNFPILTNKATSTFKTLGTQDFDFASYFTLYPNPAKSDLNITAKETINVKSISVYNTLGQLVLVATNADKVSKIDVSSLTSGNYFLQIKTDKGSSNARFVKE